MTAAMEHTSSRSVTQGGCRSAVDEAESRAGAIVCGREDVLVGGVDWRSQGEGRETPTERTGTIHNAHSHGHIRASRLKGMCYTGSTGQRRAKSKGVLSWGRAEAEEVATGCWQREAGTMTGGIDDIDVVERRKRQDGVTELSERCRVQLLWLRLRSPSDLPCSAFDTRSRPCCPDRR